MSLFLMDCILQTILHLDENEDVEKQYNVHIQITSACDAVPFSWRQYSQNHKAKYPNNNYV